MRTVLALVAALLATSVAHAEVLSDAEGAPGNDRRIDRVTTILSTPSGLIAIGGPTLRRLRPGGRSWETLHTVAHDELYRVAADESGRLLASWSKERLIHFISPDQSTRLSFATPAAPAGVQSFQLSDLKLAPDGHHALLFMTGNVMVTSGRSQGPSWSTSIYRLALEPGASAELITRIDHGFRLHTSRLGAVFAMNKVPGRPCDHRECLASAIVAYEINGAHATTRTLLDAASLQLSRARLVRGSDDERVGLLLDASQPRRLEVLRWRYGNANAELAPLPSPSDESHTSYLLTRAGPLLEMTARDGLLEIWRHDARGDHQLANLKELQNVDTELHGFGERDDGTLWLHYGDHIGLLPRDRPPRSYSIKGLLPRRAEWTGDIYASQPEQLWIGIDDAGRHFVRLDLTGVVKGAKPWPPGAPIERTRSEYAGYSAKDPSTRDRLYNASTLRPMANGGLFSMGGAALRVLNPGDSRWRTLHVIPGDNLYRVAADDGGRLIAAWEKDPSIHVFPPGARRYSFPKPAQDSATMTMVHVDELEFLPNGRDVLVYMAGSVKNPQSQRVAEPVRFYGSRWVTEVYRVALDGQSAPQLLFREEYGYRLHLSRSFAVFAIPKYPGQECQHSGCFPIAEIVAYEIGERGANRRVLLSGTAIGPNRYLSSAQLVRGSDDERVMVVLGMTVNQGKLWLNGGRALLRWRRGDAQADWRDLPGNGSITPYWQLTRGGDFIELVEHWDKKPDTLEVRRYRADGGQESTTVTALDKMATVHGLGERADGGLWFQWGDHLGLIAPGEPPRSYSLDALWERGNEWANAYVYVGRPESLWVGLDGRGRGYRRLDLEAAWKDAKPWQ